MNTKSATFLKVLGNRFHKGPVEQLYKRLPKEEADIVAGILSQSQEIAAPFASPLEQIQRIHYSWFAPVIATEAPERQGLLIGALPEAHQAGVRKLLRKNPQTLDTAPLLKQFIQQQLIKKITDTNHLPLAFLPQSELSILSNYSKAQLIELIDFLGIFDLAEEIRRLVNKNHLRAIYAALNPKKHTFLRQCLHQKEKIATPRLHLETWHGDSLELQKILHQRGLARLGKALHNQHPDLIWAIVHRLDTGRGKRVERHAIQDEKPGVVFALISQVLNVINFLQKSKP